MQRNGIIVEGFIGTWYIIDEVGRGDNTYYLLESEVYGEDTPCIAIRDDGTVLMSGIENGIDDITEYLDEYEYVRDNDIELP